MAAPLGIAQTNTVGASFIYNNVQTAAQGIGNTNAVIVAPNVQAMGLLSAQQMAGRQPGGVAYRAPSNVAFAAPGNNNAAIVQLDAMVTAASVLPYPKNGAFIVALSGTTNSVVPLTNTQTNTNSFAGDTSFNSVKMITVYNLSSLDGNNGAAFNFGKYNTNGLDLGWISGTNGVFNGITVAAGSRICIENNNGQTVNAANANIYFTPTANSTVGVVVSGT